MKETKIKAIDGYELHAHLFLPKNPRSTVIINSATAVPQDYYKKFSTFLSEQGLTVVTYDYRGINKSKYQPLKGFNASLTDWALKDAQGIFNWVEKELSPQFSVIGHSFGGQLLGLTERNQRVQKTMMVGSQSGYWRNFNTKDQWWLFLMWHVLFPTSVAALGYFPAQKLGLGENLPAGAALEWARWCRSPQYLMTYYQSTADNKFSNLQGPLRIYEILDDTYAPPKAVRALIPFLPEDKLELKSLDPKDYKTPIGHFGFFREKFKSTLWPEAFEFLSPA